MRQLNNKSKGLLIAIIIAVLIRIIVFVVTALKPITADSGKHISPSLANGADIQFYQNQKQEIFSVAGKGFLGEFFTLPQSNRGMIAGPLFPAYKYWEGILPMLPGWLNQTCSLVLLLLAKILYFLGLRPSYSDVSLVYVIMRSLPGFLFLPGLTYLYWRGAPRHKTLSTFFILPIIMVGAQDRYNMPIQPLLFFYGVKALESILKYARQRSAYEH